MSRFRDRIKAFWNDSRGMTLTEALIGIAILTVIASSVTTGLQHALRTEATVMQDGIAIHTLRNGMSWIAEDARKAQTTDLADGALPVSSMTLTWTDHYGDDGTEHNVTYAVLGDRLVRTFDGASHIVVRGVVSAEFTLSGNIINSLVAVQAADGGTRALSLQSVQRSTES